MTSFKKYRLPTTAQIDAEIEARRCAVCGQPGGTKLTYRPDVIKAARGNFPLVAPESDYLHFDCYFQLKGQSGSSL